MNHTRNDTDGSRQFETGITPNLYRRFIFDIGSERLVVDRLDPKAWRRVVRGIYVFS